MKVETLSFIASKAFIASSPRPAETKPWMAASKASDLVRRVLKISAMLRGLNSGRVTESSVNCKSLFDR